MGMQVLVVVAEGPHLDSRVLAHTLLKGEELRGLRHLHDGRVDRLVEAVGDDLQPLVDCHVVVVAFKLRIQVLHVLISLDLGHLGLREQLVQGLSVGCWRVSLLKH